MKTIETNIWGKQKEVTLTNWEKIKSLGFRKDERLFGTLNDGTPALFFSHKTDEWWVTAEKLEEIED